MRKFIKPITSFFTLWLKTGSISIAYKLLPKFNIPVLKNYITPKNNSGKEEMNIIRKFTNHQLKLFHNYGDLLLNFINVDYISFMPLLNQDEKVKICMNDKEIYLYVLNYNNLKVIEEIFIDQLYSFHFNSEFVVCDVGMNNATASLYFASFDNVKKIYAYEPFQSTFDQAFNNLALNPELKDKINIFNVGVGNGNFELEVPKPGSGDLGASTTDSIIKLSSTHTSRETVKVKIFNICQIIDTIRFNHPGIKIILKLDCEGAEYEIMDALDDANMINMIDVYMVEFHFNGYLPILNKLKNNSFIVFNIGNPDINPYGMIYGFSKSLFD